MLHMWKVAVSSDIHKNTGILWQNLNILNTKTGGANHYALEV